MHAYSYLKSSIQILEEYKGNEPLASFLKKYFARHQRYGSKDRKYISHLCYCYFRCGRALTNLSIEERIMTGLFLCSVEPNELLEQLMPGWNAKTILPLEKKLLILDRLPAAIEQPLTVHNIFPWKEGLSEGVEFEQFCESFLIQPDLFIRLRPGYESIVKTKLLDHGINFSEIASTCLSLPNASRIENIIELDKEAVVQDFNSQRVGELLKEFKFEISTQEPDVWDCCAASGGKSLMLYDFDPDVKLTVSDIRQSILSNLKKRFEKAGIKNYKSFETDLTQRQRQPGIENFDLIICDAPCTGSGTWSRTPEQLYFFDEEKIEQYSALQKKIVSNIVPRLKENGCLLYITCSVFKKENEEVVGFIKDQFALNLLKMDLLKGYDKKADTMFSALFKKELTT